MASVYIEGQVIRHVTKVPFTDFAGAPVNPDIVTLTYQVQGQTPVVYTWTNPTGDPTGTIINTSTGYFQADTVSDNKAGVWSLEWACRPSSGLDTSKTETLGEWEITVSQRTIR